MRYLFQFGFETPAEFKKNSAFCWDDQSTEAIWIKAPSAEEALAWGRFVAARFVGRLFEIAQVEGYSWLAGDFAHWIADDESVLEWARTSPQVPEADLGEMPNLDALAASRLSPAP